MKPTEKGGYEHFLTLRCPRGMNSPADEYSFMQPCISSCFTFTALRTLVNSRRGSPWQADALPSSKNPSSLTPPPSKACFYYSAQRPAHNAVAWWKFSTTLERSTWQPSFMGTHVLRGTASSIRMTLETLITNMPARPRAHMLWNNKSRRTPKRNLDVRGRGGVVPLQTPPLLFFCCDNYLAGKAFVHAPYEPNIFHPIKELLYV